MIQSLADIFCNVVHLQKRFGIAPSVGAHNGISEQQLFKRRALVCVKRGKTPPLD